MPEKLKSLSKNIVFVCYYPGAGGENIASKISKFDVCTPLEYYLTKQSRTVITNELFGKSFLMPVGPFDRLLKMAETIAPDTLEGERFHVVPSHWDVNYLESEFPNSKYIRIVSPQDRKILRNNTDYKVGQDKFYSLSQLKGYCLMYVDICLLSTLLKSRQIQLLMTIGEIDSVLKPHINKDNVKKNSFSSKSDFYSQTIDRKNILNIPYQGFETHKEVIEKFLLTT